MSTHFGTYYFRYRYCVLHPPKEYNNMKLSLHGPSSIFYYYAVHCNVFQDFAVE